MNVDASKEDPDMSNLQAEMPGECTAVSPQQGEKKQAISELRNCFMPSG